MKGKGKLSPITLLYGFGAAIVLIGAMFKFLGWSYANEMFVVGLSIEAIVFLVSAFERNTDEKDYEWEQVFPQLDGKNPSSEVAGYANAMAQLSGSISSLSKDLELMRASLSELKEGAAKMSAMNHAISDLSDEIQQYKSNIEELNKKFAALRQS